MSEAAGSSVVPSRESVNQLLDTDGESQTNGRAHG